MHLAGWVNTWYALHWGSSSMHDKLFFVRHRRKFQNMRHLLFLEGWLPPIVCPLAIMLRVTASSRNMATTFQLNFALHSMCDDLQVFFTRWLISFRSRIWPTSGWWCWFPDPVPFVRAPFKLIRGEIARMLLHPATVRWFPDSEGAPETNTAKLFYCAFMASWTMAKFCHRFEDS